MDNRENLIKETSKKTIPQIKSLLTESNIDFSDITKGKDNYIKRYVDSIVGIPIDDRVSLKGATVEDTFNGDVVEGNIVEGNVIEEKEELIMSLVITAHGCEDLTNSWDDLSDHAFFYKNNVRVYSSSCVPGVSALHASNDFRPIIYSVRNKLAVIPERETGPLIQDYAQEVRSEYQSSIRRSKQNNKPVSLEPGFDNIFNNIDKASNLITYLSNKTFYFYDESPSEILMPYVKETIGIHVVDIRLKQTSSTGEVSYTHILNPKSSKSGLSYFNLTYKEGLTNVLKLIKKHKLLKSSFDILGFTSKKSQLTELTLIQLYGFFKLLDITFVNIMDFSCRACSTGRLPKSVMDTIYEKEQRYTNKPIAFGLKNKNTTKKRTNHKGFKNVRKISNKTKKSYKK